MKFKLIIYIIFATLLSYFAFFKSAPIIYAWIAFASLAVVNYFYYPLYSKMLHIPKIISKGMIISSIVGAILFIPFFFGDFSYVISGVGTVDLLLPAGVAIYLCAIILLFIIDAYFNNELAGLKKGRIAFAASLFYIGLYIINMVISLILGGLHALSFS